MDVTRRSSVRCIYIGVGIQPDDADLLAAVPVIGSHARRAANCNRVVATQYDRQGAFVQRVLDHSFKFGSRRRNLTKKPGLVAGLANSLGRMDVDVAGVDYLVTQTGDRLVQPRNPND